MFYVILFFKNGRLSLYTEFCHRGILKEWVLTLPEGGVTASEGRGLGDPPHRRKLAGLTSGPVVQDVETGERRVGDAMLSAGQRGPERGGLQTCDCFTFLISTGHSEIE